MVHKNCLSCLTGSGSLAAMAVFESRYRPNMEVPIFYEYFVIGMYVCVCCFQVDEAKQLVRDAIAAGIFNDLVICCCENAFYVYMHLPNMHNTQRDTDSMCTHAQTHTHVCVHPHAYAHTHKHTLTLAPIHTHTHTAHTCTSTHAHTHAHTDTRTRAETNTNFRVRIV